MTELTDLTGAEYETGTRGAAVLLIKSAAEMLGGLDVDATTDAEVVDCLKVIDHLVHAASVHTLLAIESRLGELVAQQRIATALIGTGHMGVLDSDAEIRPARDAVRKLLGLSVDGQS